MEKRCQWCTTKADQRLYMVMLKRRSFKVQYHTIRADLLRQRKVENEAIVLLRLISMDFHCILGLHGAIAQRFKRRDQLVAEDVFSVIPGCFKEA